MVVGAQKEVVSRVGTAGMPAATLVVVGTAQVDRGAVSMVAAQSEEADVVQVVSVVGFPVESREEAVVGLAKGAEAMVQAAMEMEVGVPMVPVVTAMEVEAGKATAEVVG